MVKNDTYQNRWIPQMKKILFSLIITTISLPIASSALAKAVVDTPKTSIAVIRISIFLVIGITIH